jgi:hypothetical protein
MTDMYGTTFTGSSNATNTETSYQLKNDDNNNDSLYYNRNKSPMLSDGLIRVESTTATRDDSVNGLLQNTVRNNNTTETQTIVTKRGHQCFGNWCDTKCAIVLVNSLVLYMSGSGLYEMIKMKHQAEYYISNNSTRFDNDDGMKNMNGQIAYNMDLTYITIIESLKILCSISGINGAIRFNPYMVLVTGTFYLLLSFYILLAMLFFNDTTTGSSNNTFQYFGIFGILQCLLVAYPHYFFVKDYYSGIMTKDNYRNENHCCLFP